MSYSGTLELLKQSSNKFLTYLMAKVFILAYITSRGTRLTNLKVVFRDKFEHTKNTNLTYNI